MSGIKFKNEMVIGLFCFLAFSWYYLTFSPGLMSRDSMQQWMQAIGTMPLEAQHPPVMARLWKLISFNGLFPSSMLLFHLLLFWLGVYCLAINLFNSLFSQLLLVIFCGISPLGILTVHVWKDVGMLSCFVVASTLLLSKETTRLSWLKQIIFYAVLAYASGVRYNALPIALVLIFADEVFPFRPFRPSRVMFFIFIFVSVVFLNIWDSKRIKATNAIMLWDIAAIASKEPKSPIVNSGLTSSLSAQELRQKLVAGYTPTKCTPILKLYNWKDSIPKVTQIWFSAIWKYPGRYLQHRLAYLKELLGFSSAVHYAYHDKYEFPEVGLSIQRQNSWDFKFRIWLADLLKNWWIFRPFFALFLLVYSLIKKWKTRDPMFYILLSGLINFITLIPLGMAPDYRYMSWTLFTAWIFAFPDLYKRFIRKRGCKYE